MSTILVTGASGFIGAAFLARFMRENPDASVSVLMRNKPGEPEARLRLTRSLARALHASYDKSVLPEALAARVDIMIGDAGAPDCGLDPAQIARLETSGIDQIWHIAADLRVGGGDAARDQNPRAAAAVMRLASRLGCRDVVMVSTAYVFGRRSGEIALDAPPPTDIKANNAYEASKLEAELVACEAADRDKIRLTLLRPSVVVGNAVTKAAGGSTSGLYGLVRAVEEEVSRRNLSPGSTLHLHCESGQLNLVAIDDVVRAMMALTGAGKPVAPLTIHAVTGTDIAVEKILLALADRLDLTIRQVDHGGSVPAEDRLINRRLGFFRPYAERANAKSLERRDLDDAARIHDIDLLNLVEAGMREARFGCLTDLVQLCHVPRHLPQEAASPLVAYDSHPGDTARPTTVIVNAYGMPLDVMHPLIHDLIAAERRVISWDCRGLPDTGFDVTSGDLSIEGQLADWSLVRAHLTRGPVDLVGWSTGAVVASRIAAAEPEAIRNLVLMHGSFMHKGAELTAFQKNLKSVMPKVALSRSVAGLLHKSVFSENKGSLLKLVTRDIVRKSEEAMSVTRPAQKHLVQMLTHDAESVFRYARLIRAFIAENPLAWLASIACPTLVLTGPNDQTAHPQGSYDAAKIIPGARMLIAENGDHFSFYRDAGIRAAIIGALGGARSRIAIEDNA